MAKSLKPAKDLTGLKYHRLTVICLDHFEDKRTKTGIEYRRHFWQCLCECGAKCIVEHAKLYGGRQFSCGCYRREKQKWHLLNVGVPNKLPNGEASFNALITKYRINAKNRGVDFNLSYHEFRELTSQNCAYCGLKPSQSLLNKEYAQKIQINGVYIYNGVDRLNTLKGYTTENCVTCCGFCNRAKKDHSVPEFLEWIKQIKTDTSINYNELINKYNKVK